VSVETWLAFVATTAVLLVIPGPTVLAVIGYAASHGRSATLPLILGVALGDCTSLGASLVGLGALLGASAFWFTLVKIVGGLYCLYLGLQLARAGVLSQEAEPAQTAGTGSRWRLLGHTYLVTALNPKGIIFFMAFLPQFVVPGSDTTRQLLLLAATFISLAILNATLYALFAAAARHLLASPRAQRHLNLGGAVLLSAAGLWALLVRPPG
jgi:threonine/homoserine/homoserine lactone efflux protein